MQEKMSIKGVGGFLVKEGRMKVVHDSDIASLLDSLGVLEQVQSGIRHCAFCGKAVSIENIECIFPSDGEVQFCCSSPECYRMLMEKRDGGGA